MRDAERTDRPALAFPAGARRSTPAPWTTARPTDTPRDNGEGGLPLIPRAPRREDTARVRSDGSSAVVMTREAAPPGAAHRERGVRVPGQR